MILKPIIDRLNAECPSLSGKVEFVNSLMAPDDEEISDSLPLAWLSPLSDTGGNNSSLASVTQTAVFRFTVTIAAAGSDNDDEPLAAVRSDIKTALLGFRTEPRNGPIRMVGGEILDVSHRVIWWEDIYEFGYIQTAV